MKACEVVDPTLGDAVGKFEDLAVRKLYQQLIAKGKASQTGTAAFGVAMGNSTLQISTSRSQRSPLPDHCGAKSPASWVCLASRVIPAVRLDPAPRPAIGSLVAGLV